MKQEPIIQACRTLGEATLKDEPWGARRLGYYHNMDTLIEALRSSPKALVLLDGLIQDDTVVGLLARVQIVRPCYAVIALTQALDALSITDLFAYGAAHVGRPGDIQQHPEWLEPGSELLQELVFPPFLFAPSTSSQGYGVQSDWVIPNVVFLGAQALTSFTNALTHVHNDNPLRLLAQAPKSAWVREALAAELTLLKKWTLLREFSKTPDNALILPEELYSTTLTQDEPLVVLLHGTLSVDEREFLDSAPSPKAVYFATPEGYALKQQDMLSEPIQATKFWANFEQIIAR